jgi:hypothetical protein
MPGRKKELESSDKDPELPAIGGQRLSPGSVGENPPFYFDDYTNTDNFCIWLEKILCPELRPGQVVIMDNASFHKSPRIRKIIENVGCQLLYLPPYSPDLNPIEHLPPPQNQMEERVSEDWLRTL